MERLLSQRAVKYKSKSCQKSGIPQPRPARNQAFLSQVLPEIRHSSAKFCQKSGIPQPSPARNEALMPEMTPFTMTALRE